jgi:hypothetical protein
MAAARIIIGTCAAAVEIAFAIGVACEHKPHQRSERRGPPIAPAAAEMADESTQQPAVKVHGRTGAPQCYAVRDFLYRNDVPFEWVELHNDDDARAIGAGAERRAVSQRRRLLRRGRQRGCGLRGPPRRRGRRRQLGGTSDAAFLAR